MKTRMTRMAAAAAVSALACVGSVQAHHSISMFDISTPIWVKGTVVRYAPISPHAMIALEERKEGGQIRRWTIEGPFPGRLDRILSLNRTGVDEAFLKVGDVIEVCGFAVKEEFSRQGSHPSDDGEPTPFVHGHVLVMPDGHMQSWGAYGKIDNCVRPSDPVERWLDFLNADPLARDFWCGSRAYARVASITPKAFIDEINQRMIDPCD